MELRSQRRLGLHHVLESRHAPPSDWIRYTTSCQRCIRAICPQQKSANSPRFWPLWPRSVFRPTVHTPHASPRSVVSGGLRTAVTRGHANATGVLEISRMSSHKSRTRAKRIRDWLALNLGPPEATAKQAREVGGRSNEEDYINILRFFGLPSFIS